MNRQPHFADADLERALADLGRHLEWPPPADLSRAVWARIAQGPVPIQTVRHRRLLRPILYAATVALIIIASVLAASPGARSAVASWFHIPGVIFHFGGSPPGPLGHNLDLGRHVSLAEARRRVPFHVSLPTLPGFAKPGAVYLGMPPPSGRVSLVYFRRPGLQRPAKGDVALLITEFHALGETFGKVIGPNTIMTQVSMCGAGNTGLWVTGAPHVVYYVMPGLVPAVPDTIRLAHNVLLWQAGAVTMRIEGWLTEREALAIACSMRAQ